MNQQRQNSTELFEQLAELPPEEQERLLVDLAKLIQQGREASQSAINSQKLTTPALSQRISKILQDIREMVNSRSPHAIRVMAQLSGSLEQVEQALREMKKGK